MGRSELRLSWPAGHPAFEGQFFPVLGSVALVHRTLCGTTASPFGFPSDGGDSSFLRGSLFLFPPMFRIRTSAGHSGLRCGVVADSQDTTAEAAHRGCAPGCTAASTQAKPPPPPAACRFLKGGSAVPASLPAQVNFRTSWPVSTTVLAGIWVHLGGTAGFAEVRRGHCGRCRLPGTSVSSASRFHRQVLCPWGRAAPVHF